MIISKTPFRISFVGGGTDGLKKQNFAGHIVSTTINKFIYVGLNKHFNKKIRFSYSITENVSDVKNIRHEMLRETFKYFDLKTGLEIVSVGDIPSSGSGLGSSSSFLVGLINCINKLKNLKLSEKKIAEIACHIEIKILNKPIGKQDQYSAAYGGLNHMIFHKNKVIIKKLTISKKKISKLENNLFLFYSNLTRKSQKILKKVKENENVSTLRQISSLTKKFINELKFGNIDNIGKILHEGWILKKKLTSITSNKKLDTMYNHALKSGALGGKLLGAGGGGFFLFYVPKKNHKIFKNKMKKFRNIDFKFYRNNSQIINLK